MKFTPLPKVGSDTWLSVVRLEEGEFVDGKWEAGRVLNGDEMYQMSLEDMAQTKYLRMAVHEYED